MIYAVGGAGKSTLAAQVAAHVWRTMGKCTRVVNADGGGTSSAFQALAELGAAEIWDIDLWNEGSLFQTLDFATKGYWPIDPTTPNTTLMPPTRDWKPCPECKENTGAGLFGMVQKCGSCGVVFPPGTLLPLRRDPINGMEDVGCYVFEGLTAFGELLLRRLRTVDSSGGNVINDSGFKVTSPGMQHFGGAQSYLAQFVSNFRQLPVEIVVSTALELRSDDDGKPLYGPALPGKALTARCIPWFTDVLHLDVLAKRDAKGVVKNAEGFEVLDRKLFLAPHFPPDNVAYKFAAKTSAPGGMPLAIEADMEVFFSNLAAAQERAKAALQGVK